MTEEITFGVWLKRHRQRLGLTQKGLAHLAGCSVGTIRKIEADERRPSRQLADLIAQHLEIPQEQHEAFIAFARSEPYIDNISFPTLKPAVEEIPLTVVSQTPPRPPLKHNLPSQPTPFLGRDTELAALDDLFRNSEVRLVTIVGPGGMGKTRLALAYAEHYVGTQSTAMPLQNGSLFPHGVYFLSLAPLSNPHHIMPAMVEALGSSLQASGHHNAKQQVLDYLREKQMLLLLDNFEHLLAGAELVADILQAAPKVQILVTSRERLHLHEEQVYPIQGLEFPELEAFESAVEYTAVKLFLQSAQRVQPNFMLAPDNLLHLTRICHLVEGMPLAMELAAAWADGLSLADIAAEIQQNLDFLETNIRNLPARHRSMRAVFDYSWERLGKKEQSIFAQLSIFRDGFTREAIQTVTGVTMQQFSQLINKSFLQFNRQRNRYQVHELLRQFGADKLSQDSELDTAVHTRHRTYYCQMLEKYTNDLKSSRKPQALSAIEADLENVRLAWGDAVTHQDLAAIKISIEPLYRFYWNYKWHLQEGVNDFEKAIVALRTGKTNEERAIVLGLLLGNLGWLYHLNHQLEKAETVAKESLSLLQRLEARKESLMPLLCLAMNEKSIEESNRLLHESLSLAREFDDQWATADALLRLGWNAQTVHDYEKAEQWWQEALEQFNQNGDAGGASWVLAFLSVLAGERGQYKKALTLAQENMSLFPKSDFPTTVFYCMGNALYDLGAYEQAEEQFQKRLALAKEQGLENEVPKNIFYLGKIAFRKGDFAHAHQLYQESLTGALKFNDLDDITLNHDALSRLMLIQDDSVRAREHIYTALQTAIPLGDSLILLDCLATVAELLLAEGDMDHAASLSMFIINHQGSRAKTKERVIQVLTQLEDELSSDDLDTIREHIQDSDLNAVATQLLADLETL